MEVKNATGFEEASRPAEDETVVMEEDTDQIDALLDALGGKDNSPTRVDLETWKANWGQYFASTVLADDNVYIWRTLKRHDQKRIAGSGAMNQEELYQDAVIRTCLLWPEPSGQWFVQQDAGTVPSLFKQMMFKSGFVSDEMAISLINPI